ncbi:hypothetical protein CLAFUW4_14390 [Fulvia fulva]|uniref:Uncharacterized protein n=1 Tax=Passalora fulva TaxID=5499 RepID=A0A9Q8PMV2_PASFU|nr:uncharacterized protein CLAFUR5_14220 [Fulvia fulva]KAK4609101.1 hypothetical protein CLAFUR4_14386 [Fulvia fulva]KAK4609897.1 hypothetical protein CLAFUR0_14390 [Fulvia fulva]UJO25312.1 hypothetical protein CLAFUR5_14220 [Fulvia fulva]WPV22542.1 hypothetical protein CLAFUW4_14390 [Fulvia fulva]WPV37620.1 hypothetical protein CLAFUW7_14395 [Fulvia fulva]
MISHPRSAFTEQSLHQKIHADRTLSIPDLREITREQLQRTVNVREEFIDAAGMHVARLQDEVQIQDVRAKIDDAEGQVLDAKAQGLDVGSLGEKEVKERLCTLVEQQWNFLEKGKALE